jgi:hypothetical protein
LNFKKLFRGLEKLRYMTEKEFDFYLKRVYCLNWFY